MLPIPLSIYVHFPWCISKCPYCDFNSHTLREALPERQYLDVLRRDIDSVTCLAGGRQVQSVFMGGGTPSLFSPDGIGEIISFISGRVALAKDVEITLEANPATVDLTKFSDFHAVGVNRLSIGVQSFDPKALAALGRTHSCAEALNSIEVAHKAGFANFNVDLMFGIPGQNQATAVDDITMLLELEVPHVSHYQLTMEPNTRFYRFPPVCPSVDETWEMQEACASRLIDAGFERYEVSAWSHTGHRCQHNVNYWQFGDYLGIGAGAHGKVTSVDGRVFRTMRPKHPKQYLRFSEDMSPQKEVDGTSLAFEFVLNAFRLIEGFPIRLFSERTYLDIETIGLPLRKASNGGLIDIENGWIKPTELGYRFLDDLVELFLPVDAKR